MHGGTVEFGEKLTTAITREIKEETGVNVENVGICAIHGWVSQYHSLVTLFACKYFSGAPTAREEIKEVRWFTPDEIHALREDEVLDKYRTESALEKYLAGEISPVSMFI